MEYLQIVIIFILITILIGVYVIVFLVVGIRDDLKQEKEILFIESSVMTIVDQSSDFIQLFSYDNRFDKKKGHNAEYIIKFKNVSSANTILLKVMDEYGNQLGSEVYITQEKPTLIPFKYTGKEDFFNLMVKSDTENIELVRMEIEFNKKKMEV